MNRLCGFHTPMYEIGKWAHQYGVDEIYGVTEDQLNDDRIVEVLDGLFYHIETLDSQITLNMLKNHDIKVDQVHFDPSSFVVYGDHCANSGDPRSINVAYGRGGDGHKSQKQIRFGLAITGDGAIPLLSKAQNGNGVDQEMHPEFLSKLRNLSNTTDFLFVADSKFDCYENLKDVFLHTGRFLSPGVFSQALQKKFLELSKQPLPWQNLDYVSKSDKKLPKHKRNLYKAFEIPKLLQVKINGKTKTFEYRLIFVYSDRSAKQEARSRNKKIKKIVCQLEYIQTHLNKRNYKKKAFILAKVQEALKLNSFGKLFSYKLTKKNKNFQLHYEVNNKELKRLEKLDGVYALKTNLDPKDYPINRVLETYKQQSSIEQRFKVIKGPLSLSPIFLHRPMRVVTLMFIIMQALKLDCLIELLVHRNIKEQNEPLPILPENRRSQRPSAETVLKLFDNSVQIIKVQYIDGSKKRLLSQLNHKQLMIFHVLKLRPPDLRSLTRKIGSLKSRAPN